MSIMKNELHIEGRPVISARVNFSGGPDSFIAATPTSKYTFSESSAHALYSVHKELIGKSTIEALAADFRLDLEELTGVLEVLNQDGWLIDADAPLKAQSVTQFITALKEECLFWNRDMYAQPFWKPFHSGAANREQVLGWGLEYYHFVESANEHMAMGVAYCRDKFRLRELMIQHYIEEWNHSEIFLRGLVKSGMSEVMVKTSRPLETTRALIDYLNELAYYHPLAYSACYLVMQDGREKTEEKTVNDYYDKLSAHYPYAAPMLDAIRKHALIDVGLDHHKTPLERYLEEHPEALTEEARQIIVAATRGTSEHFVQFFEGILDHCGKAGANLMRRPVDVRNYL